MTYAKTLAASLVGAAAALALLSDAAFALNDESWVSGTGSGTSCTRTAPCGEFFYANIATDVKGAITVLDSGNFGFLAITKSLTVRAIGSIAGGTTAGTFGGNWMSVSVSPSDTVVLDGLSFIGGPVSIQGAGTVVIRNCKVGFTAALSTPFSGIRIAPTGPLQVVISDTTVENNGSVNGGAGIHVIPQPGGSARVMLERVTASGNQFGVAVDGSQSTAGINLTIKDSTLSGNVNDGVIATTSDGHAPVGVLVSNTSSTNNGYGIRSIGPNVTVRVDNSKVAGNGTGLAAGGGGALLSVGNNIVEANGANGAFSGSLAFK